MIIRSQNKKVICDFGAGCLISMLGETEEGYLIAISTGQDDCDMGYYKTEEEAMRAIGSIYAALKAGTEFYDMPDVSEESEDYEHPEDIELDKLQEWGELSNRTANALKRGGYITLKEAATVEPQKLMKIRNIGASSICELRRTYERFQEGKI